MADNQEERHRLGRLGERIISKLFGCHCTNHKAPFDVVDFNSKIAYEVKTISGISKDMKIHISDSSMKRKRSFARHYRLKARLIAVVIYSENDIRLYESKLKQSIRVSQMREKGNVSEVI